jgi:hypothetical protein
MDPRSATTTLYRNAAMTKRGLIALFATLTLTFAGLLTVAVSTARADDSETQSDCDTHHSVSTDIGLDAATTLAGTSVALNDAYNRMAADTTALTGKFFGMSGTDQVLAAAALGNANTYYFGVSPGIGAAGWTGLALSDFNTGTGYNSTGYNFYYNGSAWDNAYEQCDFAIANFDLCEDDCDTANALIGYVNGYLTELEAILALY